MTRSGPIGKRTYEEAMNVEPFHQHQQQHVQPVVVTAGQTQSGATSRFVYQPTYGPLVVPDKETEENEPMDDDNK